MNIRITVFILFIILCSCSALRYKRTFHTFELITSIDSTPVYTPIYWQADTFGGKIVKKSSFFVPVKLNETWDTLYMQFDLGASFSMFYDSTLFAYMDKYPELKNDTIKKDNHYLFKKPSLHINNNQILNAKQLYVLNNFGSSNIISGINILGTLGYDVLDNNILILDFKADRYSIVQRIPHEIETKVYYIPNVDLNKFPVILPFQLGKKKIRLFYDTGSSRFPIVTGTNRLKKLSKQRKIAVADSVSSWGKEIPVYLPVEKKENNGGLYLGDIPLGELDIFGVKMLNKLWWLGGYLYGITGNVIFENKILVIDRKNNRFGIID